MSPKWFVVLAMMGAVLALLFTSTSTYDALISFTTFKPGNELHFSSRHFLGLSGWLMIVLGVLAFALVDFEKSSQLTVPACLAAASCFLATGCLAYAAWEMQAAFMELATSQALTADKFALDVMKARTPMLVGWFAVVAATTLVCIASLRGRPIENERRQWWSYWNLKSRSLFQHAVAISTAVLVVVAIIWSGSSMSSFEQAINSGNASPSELARNLSGLIRADQLFALVIFGCGCLCLIAIAASQTQPDVVAESTLDSATDS
ncbi:hypothetical protein [Aporhodopirellula aestuarii]|uniref:DUF998 domain-containing protein n=1 Tax=Aporhodopirellula aestuarii TaxID=2950107 RepID=A0ABT0U7A2_9BACT|nr:hypothetical protein [Aporhodopirellula aestuarii]MCM2372666.1 hypothetical protein [Aporhodopirellula aestuarii]